MTLSAHTSNITIRMDSDVKEKAERLFNELGLDISTAFNIFVRQALRAGGIPFEINPNAETVKAMLEAERIEKDPSVPSYNNMEDLFKELSK